MPSILASPSEFIAAALFALAVLHTFSTKFFARMAHVQPRHSGLWHLLAEVEVVFGFWAAILILALLGLYGKEMAVDYLEARNFTEPLFVFVVMVIAASRPILVCVRTLVESLGRLLPITTTHAVFLLTLSAVPLLGSLITEPAAMTLAAMILRDRFLTPKASHAFKYATLGLLFVNISIGGSLTSFAAPPVLMVASAWQWDSAFMFTHFGWKAACAVVVNALGVTLLFRRELTELTERTTRSPQETAADFSARIPHTVTLIHLLFLAGVVFFAHHPVVFLGIFLLFLGYTEAYKAHQDKLILREGLLVALFLAGLVVLGGLQQWWLKPALSGAEPTLLYYLATALTAITDNAALTYLASLVDGITAEAKYAIVAGAVTGGGLTVIANAPNPAGVAILKSSFEDETISPLALFLAALAPTFVAILAFRLL